MNHSPSWPPGPATPGPDPFGSPVQRAGGSPPPQDAAPPPAAPPPDLPQYPEPRYPPAKVPDGYRARPPKPAATPPYETPRYRRPRKGEAAPLDAFGAPVIGGFPGASQYEPQFSEPWHEPPSSGLGRWTRFGALALVSLALSLASLRYIWPAPIGLVLGIVALRHVRRDGAKGQPVAITGIAIGGVISLLLLVAIVLEFINPDGAGAAAAILAP